MLRARLLMVGFGMASNVKATVGLAASRAESVSANGITATKLLVSSITMNPDEPPDPLVEGCGARDPGACAVPPPAVSPGTPVMLITTPEVGAMSVAWLSETWAAATCACAAATCAWPDASAFGLTWVCTARLSREDVICCDAELILDWPLIASMCCLLWSLANCALAWEQATEAGSMPQSLLTFAWSLATVAASAWLVAFTEATVSL